MEPTSGDGKVLLVDLNDGPLKGLALVVVVRALANAIYVDYEGKVPTIFRDGRLYTVKHTDSITDTEMKAYCKGFLHAAMLHGPPRGPSR